MELLIFLHKANALMEFDAMISDKPAWTLQRCLQF